MSYRTNQQGPPLVNEPLTGPPEHLVDQVIRMALDEDLGAAGDITTSAVVPPGVRLSASLVARAPGTVAGLDVGLRAFTTVDDAVEVQRMVNDGEKVVARTELAAIEGPAAAILAAERTCLNFLARLSGIATMTRRMVDLVAHTNAKIVDTRKTTPGLRALEKYAVRAGGGANHRFGLYDAVLIKDNHLAAVGDIATAIAATRKAVDHGVRVEVEVDDLGQLAEAIAAGADAVLLDNMTPTQLAAAVDLAAGRLVLEASGGITEFNVAAVAETGVDLISIGALTHSAVNWDVGLDVTTA